MCKLEADVVTPLNLPFYNRYVDDYCTKRKANAPDILLENLNSYHPNIKFTVEENPDHFLDTAFTQQEGKILLLKSIKNQGNYKYTGNRPSHINGKATLS